MGLRRQLLIFGSLSLALPWAGVQYVKEMEAALRYGQAMALQATAQAVAARLQSDPSLLHNVIPTNAGPAAVDAFYAHPVDLPLPVDGYDDDWRNLPHDWQAPLALGEFEAPPRLMAARRGEHLHLLVSVPDRDRQFYNPSRAVNDIDRIELLVPGGIEEAPLRWRLYTSAPGPVVAQVADGEAWQRDHRVQAIWNEREDSYLLELKMPFALVEGGLAVAVIDGDGWSGQSWPAAEHLRAVVTRDDRLDEVLQTFSPAGVRLYLVDHGGWIIAKAGALAGEEPSSQLSSLQRRWVRRLLGQADFAARSDAERQGAFATAELGRALAGDTVSDWYRYGERILGRALQPVDMGLPSGQPLAAVVAEQTTDSVDRLTSGAVGRLLSYSAGASILAALGLLGFASVLSYRVRKLSLQAQAAVDRDGRISGAFRGSRSSDEIGELSRQYAALLGRLHNYTQYLETLASKLSHELRTPLAIVRSSLDNLAQVPLPEEAQTYVARASDGSDRLSAILNAMSAAARLEQSIHSSDKEAVDLQEMLPIVVAAYNDIYGATPVTLTATSGAPARVLLAPELFVQMLDKLVENAVDFATPDSAVEVHLVIQARFVEVQVINCGPAIPESMLESIFDSLVSAREPEQRGHHLGLGLHIVRLIAHFHQARLRAVNDAGQGKVRFEVKFTRVPE